MNSHIGSAILITVVNLAIIHQVVAKEGPVCLASSGYTATLTCESPLQIKIQNVTYGVNNADCGETCCVGANVVCTVERPASGSLLGACAGHPFNCILLSETDILAVPIRCPGEDEAAASFAVIHYGCEAIPDPVVTIPTSANPPVLIPSSSTASSQTIKKTTANNKNALPPKDDETSDMGLVIGLSVAGGILIIIIVVIIAVFTTKNRRHDTSNQSQNSTKTLASSDIEASDSSESAGRSTNDLYGFDKASENQQQRLQKRNDNIKRNLSFKTEESKNKRPPKLSKGKSKSKSSSLNHLNENNSNNKISRAAESHKAKQPTTEKKKKSAVAKDNQPAAKEKTTPREEQSNKKTTPANDQTTAIPNKPSETPKKTISDTKIDP